MTTTPPPGRRAAAARNCCEEVCWEAPRLVYDDQIASGVTERRIGLTGSLHAGGERAHGDRLEIVPVRLRHAEALRRVFDTVARERRYLPVFEAPPLDDMRRYIQDAIDKDDPAIVALRSKVVPIVVPGIEPAQVDMTITLKDGRTLHRFIAHAIGGIEVPMTDRQLEAKFADLANGILPPTAIQRVIDACWGVESLPSAGGIAKISVSA